MKAVTSCEKCEPKGKTALAMHGTCDLKPAAGFKGSCALKAAAHMIDQDVSNNETPKIIDRGRK